MYFTEFLILIYDFDYISRVMTIDTDIKSKFLLKKFDDFD